MRKLRSLPLKAKPALSSTRREARLDSSVVAWILAQDLAEKPHCTAATQRAVAKPLPHSKGSTP